MKNGLKLNNNENQKILDMADDLYAQNRFDEALNLLESIPEGCNEYSMALGMKSIIIGIKGNDEESFEVFKSFLLEEFGPDAVDMDEEYKAIDVNSSEDMFNCGLASLYFFYDCEEAIKYFNRALKINPNQGIVLHQKALAYGYLGKYRKAIKVIDKAIKINPDNVAYWNDRGVFFFKLNFISKAHKAFDKSISVKPNPHAWANKGILYCQSNKFKKALKCFDEAIDLDKSHILSIVGKASVYSELKDFETADKYFKMAADIDENNCDYLAEKGKHLLNQNKFNPAIEYFDRYLEIDEYDAVIWMFKSMALSELGRDLESESCFKKAIKLDPDSISVFDEVLIIDE